MGHQKISQNFYLRALHNIHQKIFQKVGVKIYRKGESESLSKSWTQELKDCTLENVLNSDLRNHKYVHQKLYQKTPLAACLPLFSQSSPCFTNDINLGPIYQAANLSLGARHLRRVRSVRPKTGNRILCIRHHKILFSISGIPIGYQLKIFIWLAWMNILVAT